MLLILSFALAPVSMLIKLMFKAILDLRKALKFKSLSIEEDKDILEEIEKNQHLKLSKISVLIRRFVNIFLVGLYILFDILSLGFFNFVIFSLLLNFKINFLSILSLLFFLIFFYISKAIKKFAIKFQNNSHKKQLVDSNQLSKAKKKFLILLTLLIGVLAFCAVAMKIGHDVSGVGFPGKQVFYYSEEPVFVTVAPGVGQTQYKIPKAYFSSKLIYQKDGSFLIPIRLWASFKDDMAPWTLSESFKRRDLEGLVHIYIHPGFGGEFKEQFPYYDINQSKERGGGINRGKYKEVFTRYDDTLSSGKKMKDGTREKTLSRFFLIPKEEDFFITCPAQINDYVRCKVLKLYKENITYEFLIPHRIIDQYKEYDKKVQELVDRLYVPTTTGETK